MPKPFHFALLALLLLASCRKHKLPPEPPREFEVRGIVREAFDPTASEMTIEHENIPGYMPSMIMPFTVKKSESAGAFNKGDGIQFHLFITASAAWIDGLKKIDPATVQLGPPKHEAQHVAVARVKQGGLCPNFVLIDQTGWPITRKDYRKSMLLMTFMFTRCPDPALCPLLVRNFSEIQKRASADPQLASKVRLLCISVDPENDTPPRLAAYAANYTLDTDSWRFATGAPEQLAMLTSAFSVYVQQDGDTISHGLCTALIGQGGVIYQIWRGNKWTTDEVLAEIRNAAGQ
jgi:protein SCO1